MNINTRQFGKVSIDGDKIINMPDGIPGFRQQKRYVVLEKKETSPFYLFQCVDDPNLAFVIMDPLRFYPEYTLSVKILIRRLNGNLKRKNSPVLSS